MLAKLFGWGPWAIIEDKKVRSEYGYVFFRVVYRRINNRTGDVQYKVKEYS